MQLETLNILNYKNIQDAELHFCSGINCLVGLNGMGKTNVLDAIYYLSFCKSHSNTIDSQNIQHEADFFMLQGKYTLREKAEEIYCGMKRRQKKHFKRNKVEYDRLADHIGLLPLVLVSPADAELIAEGSDERRKFMDGVISQYDRPYLTHLLDYNNALKQRNALLKLETHPDDALMDILEDQMTEHAAYIHKQRTQFIEQFIPIFQEFYNHIAGGQEQVGLSYQSQLQNRELRQALANTRERDYLLGYTTQGIHKDELEMQLGNYAMKRVGSQGQNKTYLIALKLAQFDFLRHTHGIKPLLLLDDLFDKLDTQRMQRIIDLAASERFGQIFITDTDRSHLDEFLTNIQQETRLFQVQNGEIRQA